MLRFYKLRHLAPNCDKKHLKALTKQPGIWFVLEFIAENMKPSHFRDLVKGKFLYKFRRTIIRLIFLKNFFLSLSFKI